jgi:hypothetical protein
MSLDLNLSKEQKDLPNPLLATVRLKDKEKK